MNGILLAGAVAVLALLMFLLLFRLNKVLAVITGILLLGSIVLLTLSILEYFKVIDFGITKAGDAYTAFYYKNTIYFQIGYALILLINGAMLTFSNPRVWAKIVGIIIMCGGIFCIVGLVAGLQGVEFFVKLFNIGGKSSESTSEAISESAKMLLKF